MFAKRKPLKIFSIVLCCGMLVPAAFCDTAPVYADMDSAPYADAFIKTSDPDTSNPAIGSDNPIGVFGSSTLENGRLWADKSVSADEAVIYDTAGNPIGAPIKADPDQFLINLSVLSEGYSIGSVAPPIDAVFIIDLSGSMTYEIGSATEADPGNTRVDAVTDALNFAIDALMEANPDNRVAVVAYGGLSGRKPRTYPLLNLGRYAAPSGEACFYVSGSGKTNDAAFNVNPAITGPAAINAGAPVSGGTPTQRGIYAGAQMLMNNADKTYTDAKGLTVIRKPVMVLMTDGEPTFGWTDYTTPGSGLVDINIDDEYDWGDALTPDMGIDLLTVATAAYWKQQVKEWYYGAADLKNSVGYYTVGLGVSGLNAPAVLDPQSNAGADAQLYDGNGVTYYMGTLLDEFVAPTGGSGGTIEFPVLSHGVYPDLATTRTLTGIRNGGDFISSYCYTDGYYPAGDAAALNEAFKTITSQMETSVDYITDIGADDPDYSGYLTFSDVLGQFMEFKSFEGLWYDDVKYDGALFAKYITEGSPSDPAYKAGFISGLATQLEVSEADAALVVDSSIAGGSLYYTAPGDFGNRLKWYADSGKYYVGPYYSADGSQASAPPAATCVMDLYPIEGVVPGGVTHVDTELTTLEFAVLTALQRGVFSDSDDLNNELDRELIPGQQIVRWYIPASLIPMRTALRVGGTDDEPVLGIREASPIQALFAVGLRDSLTWADILGSATYAGEGYAGIYGRTSPSYPYAYPKVVTFFTNHNDIDGSPDTTTAFFHINKSNHYYYYTDPSGRTPLYESDGSGGYTLAESGSAGPFFAKFEYFDVGAQGYVAERYSPVPGSTPITDNGADAPYIASGVPRTENVVASISKTSNPTDTKGYVVETLLGNLDKDANPVQIRHFGDDGMLGIPLTSVAVEKRWAGGVTPEPVEVQLYAKEGAAGALAPVGGPALLSAANAWRYSWTDLPVYTLYPDAGGNVKFITYSVLEVSGGGSSKNYSVSYRQPAWSQNGGLWIWSAGVVTNGEAGDPPPPPTPPNPPIPPAPPTPPTPPAPPSTTILKTGDSVDVLSLWLLVCLSALGLCVIYKAREVSAGKRKNAEKQR